MTRKKYANGGQMGGGSTNMAFVDIALSVTRDEWSRQYLWRAERAVSPWMGYTGYGVSYRSFNIDDTNDICFELARFRHAMR